MSARDKYDDESDKLYDEWISGTQLQSRFNRLIATRLRVDGEEIKKLKAERETYKNIAERNPRANLKPCPRCGYTQLRIREMRSVK